MPGGRVGRGGVDDRLEGAGVDDLLDGGEVVSEAYAAFVAGGRVEVVVPRRTSAAAVRDDTGRVMGVVQTARDITDKRRLHERLQQAEHMLAVQAQAIEGLAHPVVVLVLLADVGVIGAVVCGIRHAIGVPIRDLDLFARVTDAITVAVGLVIIQGVFGGLRVTGGFTLSTAETDMAPSIALAVTHGVLGQVFLSLVAALAVVTSSSWANAPAAETRASAGGDRTLQKILVATLVLQLVLGAVQRHMAQGLIIHISLAAVVVMIAVVAGARAWGLYHGVRPVQQLGQWLMSVVTVQLNQRPVDRFIIDLAICYFIVNIFLILGGGCFMVLVDDMDYVTGMSSVIATLMNIGPGFGTIGPSENYAHISAVGKWFLSWNMLVGRLEMFSALVVFYPSFWKK